jgi:DNA ligase-1
MLAGTMKNLDDLVFPLLATPKLDGVRALTIERDGKTVAVSRKLKDIPNEFVRAKVQMLGHGFDGELTLDDDTDGEPVHIKDAAALIEYEAKCLVDGYEGVMVRSYDGPYKHGRSTVREGYLLKLKRFLDSEAVVTGVIEELHNANEAKKDNLGRTERSTAKAGKVGKGVLGALRCTALADGEGFDKGVEFKIGTGFTAEQREELWAENLKGRIVKFKYQPSVGTDKPRFPSFIGFRHEDDM